MPPIPVQDCKNPKCRALFTPRRRLCHGEVRYTEHCCRECARVTMAAQLKGKRLEAAIAGRVHAASRLWKAKLEAELGGPLTPRELRLMRTWGTREYNRGYLACQQQRRKTAAA